MYKISRTSPSFACLSPAKKPALMLLSCIGLLAANTAFAQSKVELYGLIDLGMTRTSNQGGFGVTKISSSELQGSRFGFRGIEDLGGGYQATFVLESGFNADTGTMVVPNQIFNRDAKVGLNTPMGSIVLGHQGTVHTDFIGRFTPVNSIFGPGIISTHPGNFDRTLPVPFDNSIKYITPLINGFSAGVQYAFGETTGSAQSLSGASAGASYANGPFAVGYGYFRQNGPVFVPIVLNAAANASNPFSASPNERLTVHIVGANYQMGAVTILGNVSQAKFATAGNDARAYEAGLKWLPAGTAWTLGAALSSTSVTNKDARMRQMTASASYALSKRTDIYSILTHEKTSGTNIGGTPLVAQIFALGASSTDSQSGYRVGIRHKF
jgi:predicted porin